MKYIDADKIRAEVERRMENYNASIEKYYGNQKSIKAERDSWKWAECKWFLNLITSLQREQPIEGKQVIIITETDGDANIRWDCRSLGDAKALLTSAQSFIADKQVEELRGQGSGPDYNTRDCRNLC